ncbi:hypothetical protein Acr_19g0009940 [Actinidia rufa]|uniref:Uncharacterized protein n=1 Tax=Actinidia rufa TaxID=165716 RepID=A0A7J0GB80_9ERIC|nr:hypothetical protein Acr_19g0009940 [Actinidia rufa]
MRESTKEKRNIEMEKKYAAVYLLSLKLILHRVYMKLFHEDDLFYPLKIGSLDYFENEYNDLYAVAYESETKLFQYMRLEWDGHMRIYERVEGIEAIVDDVPASRLRTVLIP